MADGGGKDIMVAAEEDAEQDKGKPGHSASKLSTFGDDKDQGEPGHSASEQTFDADPDQGKPGLSASKIATFAPKIPNLFLQSREMQEERRKRSEELRKMLEVRRKRWEEELKRLKERRKRSEEELKRLKEENRKKQEEENRKKQEEENRKKQEDVSKKSEHPDATQEARIKTQKLSQLGDNVQSQDARVDRDSEQAKIIASAHSFAESVCQAHNTTADNMEGRNEQHKASSQVVNPDTTWPVANVDSYVSDEDSDESCVCSFCTQESDDSSTGSSSFDDDPAHTGKEEEQSPAARGPWIKLCNATATHPKECSSPLFSRNWQHFSTFNCDGGSFRKPGSDVILTVPFDAVEKGHDVVIATAVCTDPLHVRHELKLSDDEEIVTPLVEYEAGDDFQFQCPVTIKVPHWLPQEFDPDCVCAYHISHDNNGLATSALNRKSEKRSGQEHTSSPDSPGTGNQFARECLQLDQSQNSTPLVRQRNADGDMRSDMSFIVEKDCILIFTDRFCGFVCSYCKKETKKKRKRTPQLYVMGSVSVVSPTQINVSAHIWDARIRVADCRQEHGIEEGSIELLELLADFSKTTFTVGLRLSGLRRRLDDDGQNLLEPEKSFCDRKIGCDKCLKKGKLLPISCKWALKYRDDCRPAPKPEVAVTVTHSSNEHDGREKNFSSSHDTRRVTRRGNSYHPAETASSKSES